MPKNMKMNGIEKASVLLISLGPDIASNIIKRLPENMISRVSYEIANTAHVKSAIKDEVLEEFMEMSKAKDYIHEGGVDYAKNMLTKALGANRAKDIIDKVAEITYQQRPFATARKADTRQLISILINEHPQTIALVLCYLKADKSAEILSQLPEELQGDVAYRISTMNRTSPTVIRQVEKILEKKLSSIEGNSFETLGGVSIVVDILNAVDRATEKGILEDLEKETPELAEQIRASMFVFEDIVHLDDVAIQRIIREVENQDIILALKGSSEDVSNMVYRNMSKRAAETLREDIEFLGPVRLAEVEQAQQKIVAIIRRLEDAGEIVIARGGEDNIVL